MLRIILDDEDVTGLFGPTDKRTTILAIARHPVSTLTGLTLLE
jgi:hypothetical protein